MAVEKKQKGGERKGAGRKALAINWATVDNFLMAGCDGTEVAAQLGMSPDTLYRRCLEDHNIDFAFYKQEKKAKGDAMLRAAQFKKAVQEGDNTMLVWLGKQRLEQSDKKQVDHKNDGGAFEPTQVVFGKGQRNE